MALKINRLKSNQGGSMRVNRRLYLTEDKKKVVEGGAKAAYLFKAKGQEISMEEVKKYPEVKKYLDEKNMSELEREKVFGKMSKPKPNKMADKAKNK